MQTTLRKQHSLSFTSHHLSRETLDFSLVIMAATQEVSPPWGTLPVEQYLIVRSTRLFFLADSLKLVSMLTNSTSAIGTGTPIFPTRSDVTSSSATSSPWTSFPRNGTVSVPRDLSRWTSAPPPLKKSTPSSGPIDRCTCARLQPTSGAGLSTTLSTAPGCEPTTAPKTGPRTNPDPWTGRGPTSSRKPRIRTTSPSNPARPPRA